MCFYSLSLPLSQFFTKYVKNAIHIVEAKSCWQQGTNFYLTKDHMHTHTSETVNGAKPSRWVHNFILRYVVSLFKIPNRAATIEFFVLFKWNGFIPSVDSLRLKSIDNRKCATSYTETVQTRAHQYSAISIRDIDVRQNRKVISIQETNHWYSLALWHNNGALRFYFNYILLSECQWNWIAFTFWS